MKNNSGVVPMDKRVLVKPDSAERKTAGGIIIPEVNAERKDMAMTKATIVAVGETAWSEAIHDAKQFGADFAAPTTGARVMIAKYGGVEIEGADGEKYRLLNDEDVVARLEEVA